jgi:hypothetical protein
MVSDILHIVPIETITFEEHAIYAAASSNESNAAWDAILPVTFPSPPLPSQIPLIHFHPI